MPASQHQSPKSDIEISQTAEKRRILDVAKDRLGIAAENLEPYGHYKAKVSMDFVKSLKDKNSRKVVYCEKIWLHSDELREFGDVRAMLVPFNLK